MLDLNLYYRNGYIYVKWNGHKNAIPIEALKCNSYIKSYLTRLYNDLANFTKDYDNDIIFETLNNNMCNGYSPKPVFCNVAILDDEDLSSIFCDESEDIPSNIIKYHDVILDIRKLNEIIYEKLYNYKNSLVSYENLGNLHIIIGNDIVDTCIKGINKYKPFKYKFENMTIIYDPNIIGVSIIGDW